MCSGAAVHQGRPVLHQQSHSISGHQGRDKSHIHDQRTATRQGTRVECDLDRGRYIRDTVFNFAQHRRIETYGLITERTEAISPPE